MMGPSNAGCIVVVLDLLKRKDRGEVMAQHFDSSGSMCITCMNTGYDAIPWTELFKKGRDHESR